MSEKMFFREQYEQLRSFPEISRDELFWYFTLSSADVAFVDPGAGRGPADRLGIAVQLSALPWLGFVPDDVASAPPAAVARLAEQLGLDPGALGGYGKRAHTRSDHLSKVAKYLTWKTAGAGSREMKELEQFLLDRAMEHDSSTLLFNLAREYLMSAKVIRPGAVTLAKMVGTARAGATELTSQKVAHLLTLQVRQDLDLLLVYDIGLGMSRLQWLTISAVDATASAVKTLDREADVAARKEGRKPANIAEFCERWGSRYEYMVPFDADSLMSADTLITLVHLMECNPRTALMQTSTDQVNGQTLFARLQQFDGLDNGRLVSWGERVWQGPASTYYGHNAIIRIAPFMEHCGLPRLPGPPPFGGDLISHDYVEAALLRRAGWDVWLVPELGESYEECPATLEEFFRRDRRWRQGDITNLQLLATPKLPLTGRVRFLVTALRDLSPPLLLLLVGLIIGLADSPAIAVSAIAIPVLIWDFSCRMGWAGVPVVSFGLSVYTRSINQDGLPVLRRFCSRILVQVLWLVAVPIRLLTYVSFVVGFACGRDVGWTTHRRTGHQSTLNHSIRAYWWHVLFGAAVTVVLILTDSWALEWLTPVLLAWILTIPLTLAFDSRRIGLLARRAGVLLTPEEHTPPPIVTRSHELAKAIRDELPPQAWHAALIEETTMAVHQAFLAHGPPLSPQDREAATAAATKYRASTTSAGNHTALTNAEKMALLRDPERVWLTIPLAAPVICYPAAVPTRMPEQQLTRPR